MKKYDSICHKYVTGKKDKYLQLKSRISSWKKASEERGRVWVEDEDNHNAAVFGKHNILVVSEGFNVAERPRLFREKKECSFGRDSFFICTFP